MVVFATHPATRHFGHKHVGHLSWEARQWLTFNEFGHLGCGLILLLIGVKPWDADGSYN
jgi:hypothetical protein